MEQKVLGWGWGSWWRVHFMETQGEDLENNVLKRWSLPLGRFFIRSSTVLNMHCFDPSTPLPASHTCTVIHTAPLPTPHAHNTLPPPTHTHTRPPPTHTFNPPPTHTHIQTCPLFFFYCKLKMIFPPSGWHGDSRTGEWGPGGAWNWGKREQWRWRRQPFRLWPGELLQVSVWQQGHRQAGLSHFHLH